jgi:hypothetical protein
MRHIMIAFSLVLLSAPAWAQSKPVCETFTDAEIVDLLGKPATVKRSILGPTTDCVWGITGLSFNVSRIQDEPEVLNGMVDSQLQNRGDRDTVQAEAGIGDRAVSRQDRYGRSVSLIFTSRGAVWTFHFEKVDQKLDMPAALSKLRALAKKVAAAP